MTTLRDSIKNYLDQDGLVAPKATTLGQINASGNGISYLAFYYGVLFARGELNSTDWLTFDANIESSTIGVPRVLRRGPHHFDQESWDDYFSMLCAYSFLDLSVLAYSWRSRCRRRFWYMNNEQYLNHRATPFRHPDGRWNVSAWIGRFPWIHAAAAIACRDKIGIMAQIGTAVWIRRCAKRPASDQGAWRMSYLFAWSCAAAERSKSYKLPRLIKNALAYWDSMRLPLAETQHGYFPDDHPLVVFSEGI